MTVKMMSSRQEKTKRELIDAMRELLNQKPFEQISVNDICDTSMNHRSTFYRYYHDKYELLQDEFRSMKELLEVGSTLPDRQFLSRIVDFAQENQRMFRNLTTANQHENMYYVLTAALEQTMQEKLTEQKANPERECDPMLTKVMSSPRPDLVISIVAGAVVNLIVHWVTQGQDTPKEEVVAFLYEGLNELC